MKTIYLLVIALILKFAIARALPLSFDEAYYWVWSQHLQLSYYDHPGFIAWLLSLSGPLAFVGGLARWPVILIGHATLVLWVLILKHYVRDVSPSQVILFVIAALASPLLGVGSIVATPDVPLLFFWTLSLLMLLKLFSTHNSAFAWLLGAAMGLGFCSKYHMVLFPIFALIGLWRDGQLKHLKASWFFQIFISGIVFSMPVLWWNFEHDFISFKFQLDHGLAGGGYKAFWTLDYLGGQVLALSPVILWLAFKGSKNFGLLQSLGWGPLVFFFLTSFKAPVEANWPFMGYYSLLVIAISQTDKARLIMGNALVYGALALGLIGAVFVPSFQPHLGKLGEPFTYSKYAEELKNYEPLFTSKYQMSSTLWLALNRPIYKIPEISRFDFYDTLVRKEDIPKRFFLLIHTDKNLPDWMLKESPQVTIVRELEAGLQLWEVQRP